MVPEPKLLTKWMRAVIDALGIHDRTHWALVLGVSRTRLDGWLDDGDDLPPADKLRDILHLLRTRYASDKSVGLTLTAWESMAGMKLSEVSREASNLTLDRFIVRPLFDDLRMAVEALPPAEQERILSRVIGEVHHLRLERVCRGES